MYIKLKPQPRKEGEQTGADLRCLEEISPRLGLRPFEGVMSGHRR
jgi:hypothetical protein